MPKTLEKYGEFLKKFNELIYSSSPISWPSLLKYFSRYLADKISFRFLKGHNSRKGDNSDKKNNVYQLFFHEESIYEISKP